ncbi:hypothetical protein [Xanthomonas vesicatoria]|uniref:hypothetical protein n=1 Tax=Xanthomonas vesicatoria TaxID=56460 RepID=UPI001E52455B|nr:hypothetical protein [Xanthomonas vesicatoria]MCC8557990.1 hypothetical protein [Xanthomonas vesicatoria]MCC8603069.1 hypothetical protein [Xanthomonas vesicatoria]MCC8609477.1 hypothetical protein [Xanthomonas vesicatoria]MCC8672777.1 hypothetical protein [Xanthomonas vesicatoria]MCC8678618.1 hypothetical protein [Xanthomonas vesicatoria]
MSYKQGSIMLRILRGLAVLPSFVIASAIAAPPQIDLKKPTSEQIAQVRNDLGSGSKYSEISQEERVRVLDALSRIESATHDQTDAQALPAGQKAAVYNDQELINTILTKVGEESRVVCTREKATGSHHTVSNCKTVGERRRSRDSGERNMSTMQRRHKVTEPGF